MKNSHDEKSMQKALKEAIERVEEKESQFQKNTTIATVRRQRTVPNKNT